MFWQFIHRVFISHWFPYLNRNGSSVVLFLIGYTHNALDPGVSLSVVVAVVEHSQPVLKIYMVVHFFCIQT